MAIPFICSLIVRFLIAASTPMLTACAKSGELEEVGADPFFERGLQHFLAGNHQIAIAAFQKALEQGGEGREAYRYLARSHLAMGQFTEAQQAVERAMALGPEEAELYDILGVIHTARAFAQVQYSDTDAALAAFQRALALDPQRATTHYNLGLIYTYRDSADLAEQTYLAALAADSTLAPAYKKLGLLYRKQGATEQALTYLRQATQARSRGCRGVLPSGSVTQRRGPVPRSPKKRWKRPSRSIPIRRKCIPTWAVSTCAWDAEKRAGGI